MRKGLLTLVLAGILNSSAVAGFPGFTHPSDGRFKFQRYDPWLYTDESWDLKMPDKAAHFYGSYALERLSHDVTKDELMSSSFVIGFGIGKEILDGYREGFSFRDILADALGVSSSVFNRGSESVKVICDYTHEKITLRLNWPFK